MKVKCTGRILEVPVGRGLLAVWLTLWVHQSTVKVRWITTLLCCRSNRSGRYRTSVRRSAVQTGYKAVDSMIPIGRGQRN